LDKKDKLSKFRTIWISDTHLGTRGAQAKSLLNFLKYTQSDTLYLVGDMIDGWQMKKKFYWPQEHNDVVQKLLRKARNGTKVIFIPGNHDEAARSFLGYSFGEIPIKEEDVHETADGKKLLVTHGDQFDNVIQHARWLAYVGDQAYVFLLKANQLLNKIRIMFDLPYWSLSQYAKLKVKSAVSFITAFETTMMTEARRRGFDGVVCGHIHKPELREVDGLIYANDGDWVESMTALVEHSDGSLEILEWQNAFNAAKEPLEDFLEDQKKSSELETV